MNSFPIPTKNLHLWSLHNPEGWVVVFYAAQKGLVTCKVSHSWLVVEPCSNLGLCVAKACASSITEAARCRGKARHLI